MSAGFLNPSAGLGANMPSDPTAELLARQKLVEALSGKGRYNDTSPKQHWTQALAQVADGAMEGMSARQQLAATLAGQAQANGLLAQMPLGSGSTGSLGSAAGRPATPGTQIPGKLGDLDTNNLDVAVRTAMAEAGSLGPSGMRDVAAVLRNRALLSGRSVAAEALLPNQFEPWNAGSKNDPRRFKTDSPEYQAALAAIRPVLDGSEADPTGGATFFYAPKAQAALGRSAPKWDDGSGEDRGAHRFFRLPYAGKNPGSLAQAAADTPADLPVEDAKPVSFLTQHTADGGFYVPPDVRAAAPAGDPSALRPGDDDLMNGPTDLRTQLEQAYAAQRARGQRDFAATMSPTGMGAPPSVMQPPPAPPPSGNPDLAALTSPAPLGSPQTFQPPQPNPADLPAPDMQPASTSPMQAPLPPARPSDADLQAPAPTPTSAPAPPPAAPASAPAPSPARQQLIAAMAQPRTDAPDPQAASGPAPREGIAALLGGVQDGLDRVFGGPQTQARLDGQAAGPRQQLAQALAPPPPASARYASLPPAGQPGPAGPAASWSSVPGPQALPAGPQGSPASPVAAAAPAQPVQVAQAGGGSDQDAQVAWAQRVMAASANPAVAKMLPLAQEILKRRFEGNYSQVEQDGRVLNRAPNGQLSVAYDKSKDDQDKWGTFTDQATGVTYQYKKGSNEPPRPLSPGGERAAKVVDIVDPAERAAAGVPPDYKGAVQRDASGKLLFPSAGGVNVTNNLGPKANEALDGTIIKKIEESQSKAEGAIGTIKAINRQKEAIDKGLVTGWGADWQTQAKAAVAKILGLPDNALTNSEVFDAASTQKSAELAKAISQAGHTTNMDLQLGKTIAGGNRELTEKAIRAIVDAQERLALDTIETHNAKVAKFAKINPSVADRAGWFQVEAPETYQYAASRAGQGGGAPAAPSAAPAPAAAPDRAALEAEARRRGLIR